VVSDDPASRARVAAPRLPPGTARQRWRPLPGDGLLSVFILAILIVVVLAASPFPQLRRAVAPVAESTGLTQSWAMFARPPAQSSTMYAEVEMADGSIERWTPPDERRYPLGLRAERWRTWWEKVMAAEQKRRRVLPPMAAWIAQRRQRDGRRPVRVRFLRRSRDTPGVGESPGAWRVEVTDVIPLGPDGAGR